MKLAFVSSQRCTFRDGTPVVVGRNEVEQEVLEKAAQDPATRKWFDVFFSPAPEVETPPPVPEEAHVFTVQGSLGPETPIGWEEPLTPEQIVDDVASFASPEEEKPRETQPEVEQPEIEQPEIEQPEIEQPEIEQPEIEQPVKRSYHKRGR